MIPSRSVAVAREGAWPAAGAPNAADPGWPSLPQGWQLLVHASPDSVAREVASRLLQQRQRTPHRPLGLATGRTMEPVYAALVDAAAGLSSSQRQQLRQDWQSFNLDDYVGLSPQDPRSFQAFMRRRLGEPLGLAAAAVQLPDGAASDPDQEARRYAERLERAGGLGLQLLGLGLNGHVGFNEPPCPAEATCRCVTLSDSTRRANADAFGGDAAAVPARAITLGLQEILAADELLLVVTGAGKAAILQKLLREPPQAELPASWLRSHANLTLIVDAAALGEPEAAGAAGDFS